MRGVWLAGGQIAGPVLEGAVHGRVARFGVPPRMRIFHIKFGPGERRRRRWPQAHRRLRQGGPKAGEGQFRRRRIAKICLRLTSNASGSKPNQSALAAGRFAQIAVIPGGLAIKAIPSGPLPSQLGVTAATRRARPDSHLPRIGTWPSRRKFRASTASTVSHGERHNHSQKRSTVRRGGTGSENGEKACRDLGC